MMKQISIACLCFLQVNIASAQIVHHVYKETKEDIVNPERGFYIATGTRASRFEPLNLSKLKSYRARPQKIGSANYAVQASLLYRGYELDTFKNRPLSIDFLRKLQEDFDIVRMSGMKLILRFAYTNSSHGGDCKDEYKICPPYGDAPRHIVLKHVQQLKPLFQKNADVIAVLQEGFIGIWGENYFTDFWGDASTSDLGIIADSSWLHRNQLLKALLDAMPQSRMVQVRTPQLKQRFVYGPSAAVTAAPLNMNTAASRNDAARIGFHNDCFLASEDDYGTFADYGSSGSKRDTANKRLRTYFEADSRYTVVGGETCDDAYSPQNDCAPYGMAEQEMAAMHYSYLNTSYNNNVNNDWDSLGCMKSIKEKLGYRIVLKEANLPATANVSGTIKVDITLENTGYATPFNPRPVQLVLRNNLSGRVITLLFNTNIQQWFTGKIMLRQQFPLPVTVEKGEYDLFLNLPDAYRTIARRPEYSIRLANENAWEQRTGYNRLAHTLIIK